MNAMLLNLGLVKIPPVPTLPAMPKPKKHQDKDNPGLREMRSRANKRNAALHIKRRAEAIGYMQRHGVAKSSELCADLKWSGTKALEVMNLLMAEGLLRITRRGPATLWTYCGDGEVTA